MIQKLINRLLRHRHFWRYVGFDELSELYVSMMFRSLSISITGLFVPVYLWQLHFSITDILMVMAWYFTVRAVLFDILSAYTVAKIGPKHTMLIGYLMLIFSTGLFLTLDNTFWPIWLLGGAWGASASFFFIPFHVDFSKVKHSLHGGKELGYINIMERVGFAIGPLIGGIIATLFGAQYIFLAAIAMLFIGIMPLFSTVEPVKLNQKLDFYAFKIDKLKYDFLSVAGLGIENTITVYLWPLFLASFIITGGGIYAKLGVIASVSFVAAIYATNTIGKIIDKKHGRKLLRVSASLNSLLHLIRPFVTTLPLAVIVNLANETVTPGYRMPYIKGWYDAADDLPGYRIVYLSSMEIIGSIAKATTWWLLVIISSTFSSRDVIVIAFVIAACASLLITSERFKALGNKGI